MLSNRKSSISIVALGAILGLSTGLQAENSQNLTITQTQSADWDDGFCSEVTVSNSSNQKIDWTIDLKINGEIFGMWGAEYTQDAQTLMATIQGKGWANIVKPHRAVDFSYCANKIKLPPTINKEGDLMVTQRVSNSWDGGLCVDVDINNTQPCPIDWSINFIAKGIITGLWDASYTFNSDTLETNVTSTSGWNDIVPADGYVNFNYCALSVPEPTVDSTQTDSNFTIKPIKIDQFGYLPTAPKIAIISNPIEGFNAEDSFTPSSTYEVRRVSDDGVEFRGTPTIWKDGLVDNKSGDKVWHFDFSALEKIGDYYIYDVDNREKSYSFKIDTTVYDDVLKESVRMLYYQRSNFAKVLPYAEETFVDGKAFPQDSVAISILTPNDTTTTKDISGGWFDAGDYNKYINYSDEIVHDLLTAYEANPSIWKDNYNIPESGNGIADILDELRYELEWILKMQVTDSDVDGSNLAFTTSERGSFLHKASALDFGHGNDSPPSINHDTRYYAPPTVSATISAVGMLAHASLVYDSIDSNFALKLKNSAIDGWNYLQGKEYSNYNNSGFGTARAEDSIYQQKSNKIVASIYLYALTHDKTYKEYYEKNAIDGHLINQNNLNDKDKAYFNSGGTTLRSHDAQLYYRNLTDINSSFSTAIQNNYTFAQTNQYVDFAPIKEYDNQTNPYLAFLDAYPWGSNQAIGSSGNMLMNMVQNGLDRDNSDKYAKVATGYLHYLHGLNPQNLVYLSSMESLGAKHSVDKIHHAWFTNGIPVAPAFLVGGAVDGYSGDATIYGETVSSQPILKAYTSDYDSYELSEPQLMYQSAYIRLLSSILSYYK
jgi:hypothetical protein